MAAPRLDRERSEVGATVVQHNATATQSSPGVDGRVMRWMRCAVVLLLPACFHPTFDQPLCGPHGECPSGLTCSVQGSCELPGLGRDAAIDAPDAMSGDAPTGNGFCYGPSGWQVCLDASASGSVPLQGLLDTDKSDASDPCLKNLPASWTATQPAACIIVGGTVTLGALQVTGSRPLVIVAQSRIDVGGLVDIASHRSPSAVGAGTAAAADCKAFPLGPGTGPPGGGGAGGSFMLPGGNGGTGDGTSQAGGQAPTGLVGAPSRLRGGCAGQPGGGGKPDDAGAGGGAIYLVSAGTIAFSGTGSINVSGAGGGGEDGLHGGGGGGSGGMIALYAATIATTANTILIADGGGGGGGSANSGPMVKGKDGHEPDLAMPLAPALGGAGGILLGAGGGDGGNGYPALATTIPGLSGIAGDTGAGGGGGGGGGGHIRSNQNLGSALVSPVVVPWP
jgi:hypothetical protein